MVDGDSQRQIGDAVMGEGDCATNLILSLTSLQINETQTIIILFGFDNYTPNLLF